MFGIAWSEILIIGIVALVVVPPKDLPTMMRVVGRWVGQMRRLAYDFQHQVNDALREAEIDDVKKSFSDLTSIDPLADVKRDLEEATAPVSRLEGQMRSDFSALQSDIAAPPLTDTASEPVAVTSAVPGEGETVAAIERMPDPEAPLNLDPAAAPAAPVETVAAAEPPAAEAEHRSEPPSSEPQPSEPHVAAPSAAPAAPEKIEGAA
ncbi:MAG: Sec-independent protein translocase protein TatB [Ancalomicrobiaceae bacterium]|nr:Sec-independent protein translocase protein TatB [Ancalomicrobiaceae bacterium]